MGHYGQRFHINLESSSPPSRARTSSALSNQLRAAFVRLCNDIRHSGDLHQSLHPVVLPPHLRHQVLAVPVPLPHHRLLDHHHRHYQRRLPSARLLLAPLHGPDGRGHLHQHPEVLLRKRHCRHADRRDHPVRPSADRMGTADANEPEAGRREHPATGKLVSPSFPPPSPPPYPRPSPQTSSPAKLTYHSPASASPASSAS